jgi:hypothetical protein
LVVPEAVVMAEKASAAGVSPMPSAYSAVDPYSIVRFFMQPPPG